MIGFVFRLVVLVPTFVMAGYSAFGPWGVLGMFLGVFWAVVYD